MLIKTQVPLKAAALLMFAATLLSADAYQLTTFSGPAATVTEVNGLNDFGAAVGYYYVDTPTQLTPNQGFLYQNGQFTTLLLPGTGVSSSVEAFGINNNGQIVGTWNSSAFIDTGGIFTYFTAPGFQSITPEAINNAGTVVGLVGNPVDGTLFTYAGGVFSTINTPGYLINGGPVSINDAGQIVGTLCPATGVQPYCSTYQAFLYSNGTLTLLNPPGSGVTGSSALEISDNGVIRGIYTAASGEMGFIDDNGVYSTFGLPQPASSYAFQAMNASGQIAGGYFPTTNSIDAVIATPTPEPSSSVFCALGLALLSAASRRAKCKIHTRPIFKT